MEVTCPHCGFATPYVPELVGREVFCLGCGTHYVIPKLEPPEEQTEQSRQLRAIPVEHPPPGHADRDERDSPAGA